MIEAGAPSTGRSQALFPECARPTGGSNGRTIGDLTQRGEGARRRPRQGGIPKSAAKDSIKAEAPKSPARGLRRTAVGRAPRATSTTPRAAPPRLASYNGTVGGTVGRASTARLSTPRQPTPLLSGTSCPTSSGRPPLREMLATIGPGHPEEYPGPDRTLYALASLRALAAEVKRVLLRLLARLRVDHELAYRYPAIVADVRGFDLVVVEIMISGRWMRWVRSRLVSGHWRLTLLWSRPFGC